MNRSFNILSGLSRAVSRRGMVFGIILIVALVAFEVFNFSTTQFALADMLGDLRSAGMRWSVVLAIAFCGIDFAGIARLFTPQLNRDEPTEVWYLFGAWLLAASFNAALPWWGVSVAVINHRAIGDVLVGQSMMTRAVPVLVAVMVWMVRVLIIGTFSLAGENMFSVAEDRPASRPASYRSTQPTTQRMPATPSYAARPAPKPTPPRPLARPEPTYHPVGMSAEAPDDDHPVRR
ncbi:MAG: hypothetical protein ACM3MF_02875 [Anaerolineae bacterium]